MLPKIEDRYVAQFYCQCGCSHMLRAKIHYQKRQPRVVLYTESHGIAGGYVKTPVGIVNCGVFKDFVKKMYNYIKLQESEK